MEEESLISAFTAVSPDSVSASTPDMSLSADSCKPSGSLFFSAKFTVTAPGFCVRVTQSTILTLPCAMPDAHLFFSNNAQATYFAITLGEIAD